MHMEGFKKSLAFFLLFFSGSFLLENCSKSAAPAPVPTPVQKATALMVASPWVMKSLTIDGVADNTFFVGLKITFTAKGYTAENGAPVWPASGTWNFTDTNATTIVRDDGLTVLVENLSSSTMQLTLTWTVTTTGRYNSVAGKHVFIFSH